MSSPLQPTLTIKALKNAYDALQRADDVSGSPLLNYVLVRQKLHDPGSLHGPMAERYAVFDVLTDVLVNELEHLRSLYGYPAPNPKTSLEAAIEDMVQDGRSPNERLIACSAAYHRFVRSDLELSVQVIADYLGYDERIVRRYADRSLWPHLVQTLIGLETQARAADYQRRCLVALPRHAVAHLVTQQRVIEATYEHLAFQAPSAFLVHGPPGAGKSTIVMKVGEKLVNAGHIGQVAWIDLANTPLIADQSHAAQLENYVCDALHLARHSGDAILQSTLQPHLRVLHEQNRQLMIVLDNADGWEAAIQAAWPWISHCVLLVTAHQQMTPWMGGSMRCVPLDEADATTLLDYLEQQHKHKKKRHIEIAVLFAESGGNPGAIRQAFRLADSLPLQAGVSRQALVQHYTALWKNLPATAQALWVLIRLFEDPISYEKLAEAAPDFLGFASALVDDSLLALIDAGLIDTDDYLYRAPDTVYAALADVLGVTLENIGKRLLTRSATLLVQEMAFRLLQWSGPHLPVALLLSLVQRARPYILMTGLWSYWLSLIEKIVQMPTLSAFEQMYLQLEGVVALRWLGRFDDALAQVERIIRESSRSQDQMVLRGEALIEKATILCYQDSMHEAFQIAQQAYELFEPTAHIGQIEHSKITIARALRKVNPRRARAWVEGVRNRDAVVWGLIARLEIELKNGSAAVLAAKKALEMLSRHSPDYARGQGTLAQALILIGEVAQALEFYDAAINLLQITQDYVGLARMYNNFGAALMSAGNLDDANKQLEFALYLQETLQDTYGQRIVRENLILLRKLQSRL